MVGAYGAASLDAHGLDRRTLLADAVRMTNHLQLVESGRDVSPGRAGLGSDVGVEALCRGRHALRGLHLGGPCHHRKPHREHRLADNSRQRGRRHF